MTVREPAELSLQNQVKTCHEIRGCFISTLLAATSCLVKTTVPWPAGRHMERQTSASQFEILKLRGYKLAFLHLMDSRKDMQKRICCSDLAE